MLSVGTPASPAPTVHPPAKTPPTPIRDAPRKYRRVWPGVSKDCQLNSPLLTAANAAPVTTPKIKPTPKLAGIEEEAIDQNNRSAMGEVKDRDCITIGSNSSCKIKPVPTQAAGTRSPKTTAKTPERQLMPDLKANANAARVKAPAQNSAPPGKSAKEAVSPKGTVTDPSQTRTGASTPFNVA